MTFTFKIPDFSIATSITIEPGSSAIFVGANGAGKTRLAVYIENAAGETAHRISAHRALSLNPAVPKIRGIEALRKLRFGWDHPTASISNRPTNRWVNGQEAVGMLNDFDSLLQALFADQAVTTLDTHNRSRSGTLTKAVPTKFETLSDIWGRLLPHRQLVISGDDIQVSAIGNSGIYPASDMSDGERAIFYLVAQALVAADSSLLIIDEPELHVHPSIMSSLWDEIEAVRKDCAFIFITHDLHFAAARTAQKYVIKSFSPVPCWTIEPVPEETGFSEELTTLIIGSRRPILFVEGTGASLDLAIYRCCYPEWTVIPRGSCEEVLHAVVTMRANKKLTRITCSGIVDADDYTAEESQYLNSLGVFPLPVSEVENLILLPAVSRAIAQAEGYTGSELAHQLSELQNEIFHQLKSQAAIDKVVLGYCRRRIDRVLKKIDLSGAQSIGDMISEYSVKTSALNIAEIAEGANRKIHDALASSDLASLLTIYDNKGMLAFAAKHLKNTRRADFEAWITRMLRDEASVPGLTAALKGILPPVAAS